MSPKLRRVELFGGVRVVGSDKTVDRFATRNTAVLLARLCLEPGRAHSREELIDLLWPESDIEAGRHNLRQTLVYLRKALGEIDDSVLTSVNGSVKLTPALLAID